MPHSIKACGPVRNAPAPQQQGMAVNCHCYFCVAQEQAAAAHHSPSSHAQAVQQTSNFMGYLAHGRW
eukprot:g70309.t1